MKRWYVIQVYAGYEEAVKAELQKSIHEEGLEDFFGEILIPSAKIKQLFGGEESKDEQLFPGYLLVEMEVSPDTVRLVRSVLRVIRFLGGMIPVPLSKNEVDRVLLQVKGELIISVDQSKFIVGSEIEISEGPFSGFVGIIDEVDEEGEKLTIMVSIFGRMTPVELGFGQVKQ